MVGILNIKQPSFLKNQYKMLNLHKKSLLNLIFRKYKKMLFSLTLSLLGVYLRICL